MNTAEYIVNKLEELGVSNFFGFPGDYNLNIIETIENNRNVNWIGCINELNAGYAADGYARIKGYGALITSFGTGELSAINAIAGSYAENVPIVHIVGLPSSKLINKNMSLHHNFQETNYNTFVDTYKNVTAATAFLTKDNSKSEIDRVLRILVKEKQPVYIALPNDVAQSKISDKYIDYNWTSDKKVLQDVIKKISNKINQSKRPVILGDVLIKRFDAEIEYREFVESTGFPVTNFIMGTNLIDSDYKNYLGTYFGNLKNPIAQKQAEDSDCLIVVGAINSDFNTCRGKLASKINNDIAIYGTYCYVDGKRYDDIRMSELLEKLTKVVDARDINITKPNVGYKDNISEEDVLNAEYIYPRLQNFFNNNDIIFAETGTAAFGIAQTKFKSSIDVQYQMLWASAGWATPAAFGASLAKPEARVILVTGEGAHQSTAIEIGSMLKYGVKPIIIVINNCGYAIGRLFSNSHNDNYNDTIKINYARFARVFEGDVWATQVTTADDFDKALKVTQIMKKMCYIEVCTDKTDAPKIVTDFIKSLKISSKKEAVKKDISKNIHEKQSKIKEDEDISEEIILINKKEKKESKIYSGSFSYETVVHESIKNNEYDEDTENEEFAEVLE